MLFAQSLGEYGLVAGLTQGVMRLRAFADPWMNESGALILGGVVVGGWVIVKLLRR
jgi:hypothetical protein